jgi:long-chain acyl-CoA synthetase
MKRISPYKNLGEYMKTFSREFSDRTVMQIRKGLAVERYTYREMFKLMEGFASHLLSIGIRKGDKVLIWGPNMPEWGIALGGILLIGAVSVPVSMHATPETADEYLRRTKAKLLIRSRFVPDKKRKGVKIVTMEDVSESAQSSKKRPFPDVCSDDLAEIMYTSGTTGDPSGVLLSHGNILDGLEGLKLLVPPSKEYRLLSILPLSHALEQYVGFFTLLRFGATVYYLPRTNPIVILRALSHYRITHMIAVPELLKVMWNSIEYQAQQRGGYAKLQFGLKIAPFLPMSIRRLLFREIHKAFGGELKLFACAGAPLDRWVGLNWQKIGVVVLEGYGLTETSAALTANQIGACKIGSVGKVLPGVEIKFTEDGELLTRGMNVTRGYFNNPKKTKGSFTKDGYFRTGDVGYLGEDGFVYLTGRKKFKIVTPTGEKVYPEDVERTLNDHPAVKESCVVGIKKGSGEIVHAVLILKLDVDPASVVSEVNKKLESHQIILEWSLWEDSDFPRTRTLKKDRNKVKAYISGKRMGLDSGGDERTMSAPTFTKDPIAEIISMVFSVERSAIKDDSKLVFDLHLDSLRRVTLISIIEDEFGITLEEKDINENTTVGTLRTLVKNGKKSTEKLEYPSWPLEPPVVFLRDLLVTYILFPFAWLVLPRVVVEHPEIARSIKSPSIVIFNHVGHLEPAMILSRLPRCVRRHIATLAESRVYSSWLRRFHMYFTACAFPVETTGGPVRHSLEFAANLLEKEWSLILSPEGMISPDGTLQPFKHGTSVLAIETGVPVYPVKVKGYREAQLKLLPKIFDIPRPWAKVTLVFGKPLTFDSSISYEEATDMIRKTIEEL